VQQNCSFWSSTLTATMAVPGAPPAGATPPFPVMMPVTLVPWPLSSAALVPVVPPPGQHPDPPLQKQR